MSLLRTKIYAFDREDLENDERLEELGLDPANRRPDIIDFVIDLNEVTSAFPDVNEWDDNIPLVRVSLKNGEVFSIIIKFDTFIQLWSAIKFVSTIDNINDHIN